MTVKTKEPVKAKGKSNYENQLHDWVEQEKAAIELIGIIGKLWFDKSVELIMFRNQLVDRSASEIMNLHQYAHNIVKKTISVHDTLLLANELLDSDLAPSRIDIGKLTFEWTNEKTKFKSEAEFVAKKLSGCIGEDKNSIHPKDVVLYGFGRIGRLAARELISQAGNPAPHGPPA